MNAESFSLDTNILVYSVDRDAGDRHHLAKEIMLRAPLSDCMIALQALSEFYAAATRKRRMPPAKAALQVGYWLSLFPPVAATPSAIRAALQVAAAGLASYWDALLVASVAEAGCAAILTEDMTDGSTLLGVRIVNPFDGAALSRPAESLLRGAGP
jgi:predicted nucleic acid-binding protein